MVRSRRRSGLLAALLLSTLGLAPALPGALSVRAAQAATPTAARGYWFVASDGGLFAFGDAKFYGSTGSSALRSSVVGIAASKTGKGYWFVTNDGSVYPFGDAGFYGSMGGRPLSLP